MDYNTKYMNGLHKIMNEGVKEYNQHKNINTTRYFGLNISLDNINYIPLLNIRRIHPKTVAAELAWMIQGTQSTEWLNKYTKIWNKFEDEPGKVTPAYGYRWRKEFGRDQLGDLVKMLKHDKAARHGVVSAWHPGVDGLGNVGKYKNTPCPHIMGVNIIDDKLNLHVTQRSADYLVGVPYDIAVYGALNNVLAKTIGVNPGKLQFTFLDAHVYEPLENNIEQLRKNYTNIMVSDKQPFNIPYNPMRLDEIEQNPDRYVSEVIKYTKDYEPVDNLKDFKVIQ